MKEHVLTYINSMLIHINLNNLRMSILFCNFAIENLRKWLFDILTHRHHRRPMENTYRNINNKKLRPTRTREIKMTHSIKKEAHKFSNKSAALAAFCSNQFYFIQRGFLTSSYVNLENEVIELTVHFDYKNPPTLPKGYNYSQKEIISHTYYMDSEKQTVYVRCLRLTFKY